MSPAIETQLLLERPASAKKYIATYIQVSGPDFDVEDFFQKTSELALDELQGHLHQLSGELQSELGTIVHRDFDKFIEVFRELGQLGDDDMEELDEKIGDFSDEVTLLYNKVKDEGHKYSMLRKQREENQASQREILFNVQLKEDLTRLRKSLSILHSTQDTVDVEITTELLIQVKYALQSCNCNINADNSKAWSEIIEEFYTLIDGYLADIIGMQSNNNYDNYHKDDNYDKSEAWKSISTVYLRLGKVKSLQEAIQSDLWHPLIQKMLTKDRIDALKKSRGPSYGITFFEDLTSQINMIHQQWYSDATDEMEEIFIKAIICPTLNEISDQCITNILSPAIPSHFVTNYTEGIKFLKNVSALLSTKGRGSLVKSPAYKKYLQSWPLPIYYQLCFKEITSEVESALESTLEVSQLIPTIKQIIIKLASPKMVLPPLRPRFLRLLLQVFARCCQWCLTCIKSITDSAASLVETLIKKSGFIKIHSQLVALFKETISNEQLLVNIIQDSPDHNSLQSLMMRFSQHLENSSATCLAAYSEAVTAQLTLHINQLTIESFTFDWNQLKDYVDGHLLEWGVVQMIEKLTDLSNKSRKAAVNYRRIKALTKSDQSNEESGDIQGEDKILADQTFTTNVLLYCHHLKSLFAEGEAVNSGLDALIAQLEGHRPTNFSETSLNQQ